MPHCNGFFFDEESRLRPCIYSNAPKLKMLLQQEITWTRSLDYSFVNWQLATHFDIGLEMLKLLKTKIVIFMYYVYVYRVHMKRKEQLNRTECLVFLAVMNEEK